MAKYRKRPVTIDAVQFVPEAHAEMLHHLDGCVGWHMVDDGIAIPTLEGEMIALPGDWIIKGVAGEYYPCKPAIFQKTYELAALEGSDAK